MKGDKMRHLETETSVGAFGCAFERRISVWDSAVDECTWAVYIRFRIVD